MSMFDGSPIGDAWNGFNPQPEPESRSGQEAPAASEPAVPEPAVEAEPEPASDPVAEPKGEGKSKPRPEFTWTADRVRKVREALDVLDDERTRSVVAEIAGGDPSDVDRLALHVLKGSLAAPIRLLVAWHDEQDGFKRVIMIGMDLEKDVKLVRKAARVAVILNPELAGVVKPTGSKPAELQYALAQHAPELDVDALKALA
ncbi:hypothetical protein [Bifidobacterium felsineum]|uniref:hypothetical protein n=1 Tax=Bifidobacterium felsineum TaxID=2045440 RepID=UPI001BDC44AC|nr:hypothetical protein [Bifidobacterium felsineum]MBT1164562.1 hypothetical protein [Bifidobacterium felsineum]